MEKFDLFIIVASFLLIATFSIIESSRIKKEKTYLLYDRKTPFFALLATLVMTELNPAMLISFSSVGYLGGFYGLWMPVIFLVGIGFYSFVVAKKYKRCNKTSICEILSEKYGSDIGKIASAVLIFAMIGFCSTYIKSLLLIFKPFFPFQTDWKLSLILVALVLLMTLRGGLFSIIRVDIITFILTLIFFPIFLYVAMQSFHHLDLETYTHVFANTAGQSPPFAFIFSLIVLTCFTYILAPWYGQKIFSAKTPKIAFLAAFFASIVVFFLYSIGVLLASLLKVKGAPLENIELALPQAILILLPAGLRGLGFLLLFFAGVTTLAGVWSAMSSMIMADFFVSNAKRSYKPSLWITSMFAMLSLVVSNIFVDSVFQKIILANVFVFSLSFALLGAFYWEKSSRIGALVSIFVGLFWGFFCFFYFGEKGMYTWYWAIFGVPLVFGSGITFSLLFPHRVEIQNT
ncbi:MAG: hypothetical protein K940chlam8_00812 [Chlamydiae bacterium]|nr:hypothetical protein [Chlamydiota bacterium]